MREIRDVLVLAEGPDDAATIEYSARVASQRGAHLTAVFSFPTLRAEGAGAYAVGPAIRSLLEAYDAHAALQEQAGRALFERIARDAGVAAEWRTIRNPLAEDVVTHARYADLAILRLPRPIEAARLRAAQSIVFASGRPMILLPRNPPGTVARRILVGWNASREATRAIADALPFLARAEAVELMVVDPDPRHERHGGAPGADIARHLARHDVRVDIRVVESGDGKAGPILLSRASELRADLVVMGAYGHSRTTEFVFGGVTRTALHEADLPLLMSR